MALYQVTAPAIEPVSVEEAQNHMHVDATDENALIAGLITAARRHYEGLVNRSLINTTWRYTANRFPDRDGFRLPRAPLSSVTSVKYYDADNAQQTLASSVYATDTDAEPGRLVLAYGQSWPTIYVRPDCVQVTYVSGYGSTRAAVPEEDKVAIKMILASWFENREAIVTGTIVAKVPFAVESIVWLRRVLEAV